MMNGSLSARYARVALALALSGVTGAAAAATLVVQDEDSVPVLSYSTTNSVSTFNLSRPMLCGNTAAPTATAIKLKPVFGNFLFGTYDSSGLPTQIYQGVAQFTYGASQAFTLLSDGSLSCYVVTPAGVRKYGTGLFSDTFDDGVYDSSVAIRVVDLPTSANGYVYTYFIDVKIPTVPTATNFELRDGFDKSVFDYAQVNWCEVNPDQTSCPFGNTGNVAKTWDTFQVAGGTGYNKRFVVKRRLKSGVTSVPVNGNAVVLAALFVPESLPETRVDNNVAAGGGALSDLDPTINTTGSNVTGLTEGGSRTGVTFVINDDTTETAGNLLGATVNLNFNGSIVPAAVDCGSAVPLTGPVQRTCSFDITAPSANFATGGGVTASAQITVTDPHGQHVSTALPLTFTSTDNDPPVYTLSATAAPDTGNGNMPTLTCSLATFAGKACNGSIAGFIAGLAPAPANAVDELANQTANFVPDTSTGGNGNINCALDSGSLQIFTANGRPQLSPIGPATSLGLTYILNTVNAGSATCTIVLTDAANGSFPGGQVAQTVSQQFRIVVTN